MPLTTPAALFSRVATNLGRSNHAGTVALVPDWVNICQRELSQAGQWWWNFAEQTSQTLAEGDDTIDYPDDFLNEEYIFLQDSDGNFTEVRWMDEKEYRETFDDLTGSAHEGVPAFYAMTADNMLLRPKSNDAYTVYLGYWKQLADLTSGGDSNELLDTYPYILEAGGTYKGFLSMQEYEDAQFWKAIYDDEMSKMRVANAERELPSEMMLAVRGGKGTSRLRGRVGRLARGGRGRFYSSRGY